MTGNFNILIQFCEDNCCSRILAERIKYIREKHKLSIANVAEISSVMGKKLSSSALSRWENEQATPDVLSLLSFTEIFGIDVYWLVGKSELAYNNNVLLNIERKLLSKKLSQECLLSVICNECSDNDEVTSTSEITIYPHSKDIKAPELYVNEIKRCELYKPECRGNIIFLLNRIKYHFSNNIKIGFIGKDDDIKVNPCYLNNSQEHLLELRYFKLCENQELIKTPALKSYIESIAENEIRQIEPLYRLD